MIRNDYRSKWITNDLLYALSTESKIITEDRLNAYISENDQVCRETIEALKEHYLISQEGNDKGEYSINTGLISKRELSEDECVFYGNDLSENAVIFLIFPPSTLSIDKPVIRVSRICTPSIMIFSKPPLLSVPNFKALHLLFTLQLRT